MGERESADTTAIDMPMTDRAPGSAVLGVTATTAPRPAGELPILATDDIAADQAKLLLNSIPVGFAGTVIPAGAVAWVLRGHVPAPTLWLWIWFVWMVLVQSTRLAVWFAARPEAELRRNPDRWLFRLRMTVLMLGLSWALLPLLLFPASPLDGLFVATVIAAVCGAGVAQQSSDAPSALFFMLPSAISLSVRLLLSPDPTLQASGYLAIMYFAYLALATRRIHASFRELALLHARAAQQSLYDALTRLPNRSALTLRLQDALARAKRNGTEVAVGYVDLDDFKRVNDMLGHDAGDALLREVARRWRTELRETELIARLGGDEFAIVIESIDPGNAVKQLAAIFERVHLAVATPILVSPPQPVQIGMTMGVARFPVDSTDPDMLLRQADASMYQLKRQKTTRREWWQLGVSDTPAQPESPIDPYGSEAAEILTEASALFDQINAQFIDAFYLELETDSGARALLLGLDDEQFAGLKRRQVAYLRFLVSPDTTLDALKSRARQIGAIHFLSGVSGSMLARSSVRYRSLLGERVNAERLPASRRYHLLTVVESRVQDELQAQFSAGEEVNQSYLEVFSRQRPFQGGLWTDASQQELDFLAGLSGVLDVVLTRLNREGELTVERSAAKPGSDISAALRDRTLLPDLDPTSPRGQNATSTAWRTQTIERIDSWARDPRVEPWRDLGARFGIRSNVAIPFAGQDGHVVGVLTIYGTQPNQFASAWMQQWTAGVQRRMESIWAQCSTPPGSLVLSEEKALNYRERLFAGGLQMYMQPIADLETGEVTHVEALARLRMPDGTVVPPALFIPLLGDTELDRVFRVGLDQALEALRAWDAQGLAIDMSINLPPSTLLDPDCAGWVEESLRRHAVEPRRLALELLETQAFDSAARREAIHRLRKVGIRLAMDDLGTGYSSIHRLSTLKFDSIKIDQNLILQIYDSPLQTITLIGTLVLLGLDLGQSVVVEGIEDEGMLEVAAVFGAKYAQGYAIAAPMPASQVPNWLGGFAFPIEVGAHRLQTYAGALACHWRFVHLSNGHHPSSASDCPLGRFLHERGCKGTEIDHWHACIHTSGAEAQEASQKLSNWLAERVQASRPVRQNCAA
ncbi:oxygen sensor protein DosP [mine drainage metagenome]|uniref:Oxygen sensor protein DosP n=1 Tax=mine drainage metagenome TaxID=410659 RepID=A0A1J5QNR5_9ZZZZ